MYESHSQYGEGGHNLEKNINKMIRTVSQKMGIKENSSAFFVNSDKDAIENIHLPTLDIFTKLEMKIDYIHLFVKTQSEFIEHFSKLKEHLNTNGMLWVS